jgi:hypothetical protein
MSTDQIYARSRALFAQAMTCVFRGQLHPALHPALPGVTRRCTWLGGRPDVSWSPCCLTLATHVPNHFVTRLPASCVTCSTRSAERGLPAGRAELTLAYYVEKATLALMDGRQADARPMIGSLG